MVYRGHLSSACKICRAKRRKCDERRPSCSQCARAGAVCSGYRDLNVLRIHDETVEVAEKAFVKKRLRGRMKSNHREHRICHTAASQIEPSYDSQGPTTIPQLFEGWITVAPSTDIEGLAFGFFMNSSASLGLFSYLPTHWEIFEARDTLNPCVKAVSLALLCFKLKQPGILRLAKKYYIKALADTNKTLSSPEEAKLDSTLVSVLLLSAFEAAMFWEHRSSAAWTAHVQGSTLLLQLRGRQQIQTSLGRLLFEQTSTNIRITCLQNSLPIPSNFTLLHELVVANSDHCNLSGRLGLLWDRFISLKTVSGINGEDTDSLIAWNELGEEVDDLLHKVQLLAPYDTAGTIDSPKIPTYKGMARRYSSHTVACQWNVLRMFRLSVQEATTSVSRSLCPTKSERGRTAELIHGAQKLAHRTQTTDIGVLIDEVLATMPFLLANLKTLSLHSVRSIMWSLVGISRSVFSEEPARLHSIALLRLLQAQIRLPNIPFTAGETEWPLVTHDWLHMSLMPDFTADSPPQD